MALKSLLHFLFLPTLVFFISPGARPPIASAEHEVTVTTFEPHELRPAFQGIPLYCKVSPEPKRPVTYRWVTTANEHYLPSGTSSQYVWYRPQFNHLRFARVHCTAKTEAETRSNEILLGSGSIHLEVQGYVEAVGNTTISIEPLERLVLNAQVTPQYATDSKSPLLNVMILTRWTLNGTTDFQYSDSDRVTLSINNTQPWHAGVYRLEVYHFFISRPPLPAPATATDEDNATAVPVAFSDEERYCSGVILDALGLYAIFDPVEFHVTQGTGKSSAQEKTTIKSQTFEFLVNNPTNITMEIPLQPIRGINYTIQLNDKQLHHILRFNGDNIISTDKSLSRNQNPNYIVTSEYRLTNRETLQLNVSFEVPQLGAAGLYEFDLFVDGNPVLQHLNETRCAEEYVNFVMNGIRLRYFLVGTATFELKLGDRLVIDATERNFTTDNSEGSTLSCSLSPELHQTNSEISWHKNGYEVTSSRTIVLQMNTGEIQDLGFLNMYGSYMCAVTERVGSVTTQAILIAEKAPFSFQLKADNGLGCDQTSIDAIQESLLKELRLLTAAACDCTITKDHFTMATMTCDGNIVTLSAALVYSNEEGDMTATDLLQIASGQLMGERTLNGETLFIDTDCGLRDTQGNCIQGQMTESNQLTIVAILLLALLCTLVAMAVLAGVIGCALKLRRHKSKSRKTRQSEQVQNPLTESQPQIPMQPINIPSNGNSVTNEPQPYSYPMVHSLEARRAASVNSRSNSFVITTRQNTNCIPNPAYNTTVVGDERSSSMQTNSGHHSMSQNRQIHAAASQDGTTREHIYDYPQFESHEAHGCI